MAEVNIEWIGLKELKEAIKRNPKKVENEAKNYISRGLATYKRGIKRDPWRVGGIGGGSPVDTGNLRDTHATKISMFEGIIFPNQKLAPYAAAVHDGKGGRSARPWLDYVKRTKDSEITTLYKHMLDNIVIDLAK